jgi:biopolymer transport protein ExbD
MAGAGGGGQTVPVVALFDDSGTIGKHPPMEDVPDFTPMIDMTFLLLAFFIVTSTMEAGSLLKLPPARSGAAVGTRNSTVITVFHEDGRSEAYLSDGRKQDGPATMSEVTDYVRRGVAEERPNVIIRLTARRRPALCGRLRERLRKWKGSRAFLPPSRTIRCKVAGV